MKTICTAEEAIRAVRDGDTIMIGGFGSPGTPFTLIEALLDHGARDLTVIKNDANETGIGLGRLLQAGRVRQLVASHIGLNRDAVALMNEGVLGVELVPQGILAERIRCGGVGLPGIISDVAQDLSPPSSGQPIAFNGRRCTLEAALRADVALIHAHTADHFGNLRYHATATNFNPLMAMAAKHVVVECLHLQAAAPLPPDDVHSPGIFVDALVAIDGDAPAYGLMEHHIHV